MLATYDEAHETRSTIRHTKNFIAAKRDREEAFELTLRCYLKLLEIDCHLQSSRLRVEADPLDVFMSPSPVTNANPSADEHVARAQTLVSQLATTGVTEN